MTNDYAALVAMLDQAAADLQAEIDAAIDRHGLLVRTANQLRAEADGPNVAAEPGAILSVHERCTQEQRDALKQRLVVGGVDHVLPHRTVDDPAGRQSTDHRRPGNDRG